MTARLTLVAVLALLATGCGDTPRGGTRRGGAALVRHVDPKGFELSAPHGWRVATDAGLLITARSPDGSRLVAVAPFLSPDGVDARGCLSRAPSTFSATFADARLGTVHDVAGTAQAVAELRFGSSGRATLLCAMSGRAGVLYALAAPRADYVAARPQLLAILRSLRFRAVAHARPVDAALRFRTFRDPAEGAFSAEVPDGWETTGGLIRRGATEAYPRLNAVAPGGRLRVFAGLTDPRTYATPNAAGVPEGTELPYAGATLVVSHYVPGPQFARAVAERFIGCDGASVLGGGSRPGVSSAIANAFQSSGVQVSYDVGDVRFSCTNAPRRGYVVAATVLADTGSVGTWAVDRIFGYQASPATEPLAKAVLKHLIASWRTDPQWQARQQRTTAQVSEINRQADEEISGLIKSSYESKQAIDDEVYRNWSNATLGQTDVRDPGTGTEYRVQSGHNFYWRELDSDTVTGTDTDAPPDIDFTPLAQL